MKLEPEANCPLDGFKPCRKLGCAWFTQMRGVNPQTGQEVDNWGCAIAWMPLLLVENSNQQRQTAASVDSMRNEIVQRMDTPEPMLFSDPPALSLPRGNV